MANSVTAQKGRNFLLKISDGTSPTTFVAVTGLRATAIALNGGAVDISNKGSGGWREMLPGAGVKSITISADGVFDSASAQFRALQNALLNDALVQAQIISGAGDSFVGTWSVSSLSRTGNHDAAEMYSITLDSSGLMVYANP